jgi:uncharacterized protein (DUF2141 family)
MGVRVTSGCVLLVSLAAISCSTSQRAAIEPAEPVIVGLGTVLVEIGGLRNTNGRVNVSLFAGADGFPQDTAAVFKSATLQVTAGREVAVRFDDLSFGDYAVAVLHDENGNGVMDTGFLGIPSEGFGFSNNPRPGFGPPSFQSCKFGLDRHEVTVRLEVRYF